jgi:hypothetical protein
MKKWCHFRISGGKLQGRKEEYMRVLLLLFFAFSVHAQSFQYRLEGSFTTVATPDPSSPTIVNYSINWNETSDDVQGVYQDNYFTKNIPRTLTGSVTPSGREMNVILPETVNDVRQLSFAMAVTARATGSVSMNITTRNNIGSTIDQPSTFALLTALPNAFTGTRPQDAGACIVGFGALSGMCGVYNGTFNEARDSNERCNLLANGNPRLEMGTNTSFSFILNYIPGVTTGRQAHTIGTFLPSPQNNSINIAGRNCGDLPGTSFVQGSCKTLNLNGLFTPDNAGNYQFTGTYTISDDGNGDTCAYTMNLRRETSY